MLITVGSRSNRYSQSEKIMKVHFFLYLVTNWWKYEIVKGILNWMFKSFKTVNFEIIKNMKMFTFPKFGYNTL